MSKGQWISVIFLLSLLSLSLQTFPEDKIKRSLISAVRTAESEMMQQLALNEKLFRSGIDGDKHKFDHKRMHSMFQFMKKSRQMDSNIAEMLLQATQMLSRSLEIPLEDLKRFRDFGAKWLAVTSPFCKPRLPVCDVKALYRTIDGSCNNRQHPTWGMSDRDQLRFLPPDYDDGISVPRQFGFTGTPLPSPRLISNTIHKALKSRDLRDVTDTMMVMQWGQLLDHDILDTPVMQGERKQINQATAYIDASYLYGADSETSKKLRAFKRGFLKMTKDGLFAPHEDQFNCVKKQANSYCMKSGDERLHVVPGLAAIQILMLREHNRIARILGSINKQWNDEKIYQETRKIVIAINQHITYAEYLPKILGRQTMKKFSLYSTEKGFNTVYDSSKDATISNVFGAAAFRFGHSQITHNIGMISYNNSFRSTNIEATFNKPSLLFTDNNLGTDNINRWLCQEKGGKADRFLDAGVRDKLFFDEDGKSFDLASLNIQRGRDHGIPGYNAWRNWCGLPVASHFGTGAGGLVDIDSDVAERLKHLYSDPNDIDLFTGGLSEHHVHEGRVGPTFACIIGRQFHNLKRGDRFWYENNFRKIGFTEDQLNEIKKIKLSHLICRNTNTIYMARNAFNVKSIRNPFTLCYTYDDLDFGLWKANKPRRTLKFLYPPILPMMHLLPVFG
ncbi:heme binding [Mactra antiquata]